VSHDDALTVLGLKSQATASEMKTAYRNLVKVWHPDRCGDDPKAREKAEAKLREINLAYKVLQNPDPEDVDENGKPWDYLRDTSILGTEEKASASKARFRVPIRVAVGVGSLALVAGVVVVRNSLANETTLVAAPVVATAPAKPVVKPLPVSPPVSAAVEEPVAPIADTVHAATPTATSEATYNPPVAMVRRAADVSEPMRESVAPRAQLVSLSRPMVPASFKGLLRKDRVSVEAACARKIDSPVPGAYRGCLIRQLRENPRPIHVF
jgi:hypothetical protein